MILWFSDGYREYATCILVISVISAVTSLVETRRNLKNIQKMAYYSCPLNVKRDHLFEVDSGEVVPGDIVEVPENRILPCDLLLLTGSCIANEAMLTGESIPVIKSSLPHNEEIYDINNDSKYTLFGGTKIIQTRRFGDQPVMGLVIRTGFVTTKGNLVRDILYPKPTKFKFYRDSLIFIGVMAVIAVVGFCCTLPYLIEYQYLPREIIDKSLDLITITVPPALPAAMTVGTVMAISRLKK